MQAVRSWCSSAVCAGVGLATLACVLASGGVAAPTAVAQEPGPNLFTTIGITRSETRANSQICGNPTLLAAGGGDAAVAHGRRRRPTTTFDNVPLRMPDTSGNRAEPGGVPRADADAAAGGRASRTRRSTSSARRPTAVRPAATSSCATPTTRRRRSSVQLPRLVRAADTADAPRRDRPAEPALHARPAGTTRAVRRSTTCPTTRRPAKTLVSVTLPSTTTPGNPPIQAYLMALTLERGRTALFETPDLSGSIQFPDDRAAPVTTPHARPGGARRQRRLVRRARCGSRSTGDRRRAARGVEQMMYRDRRRRRRSTTAARSTIAAEGDHLLEYRSIDGAGNAEDFKPVRAQGRRHARRRTTRRTSPGRAAAAPTAGTTATSR